MTTLRVLMDRILTRLRMETSLATQTYSEDAIREALQHKFDVLFDAYWFDAYMKYQEAYTLDGTTGLIIGSVEDKIDRFSDIRFVHCDWSPDPLPRMNDSVLEADTYGYFIRPYPSAEKIFQVIPQSTTGSVYLTYRQRPAQFVLDDAVIAMDEQALIAGTCYDILESDATNPADADKFRNMFDQRVVQLQKLSMIHTKQPPLYSTPVLRRWI